ncbi:MAG TPA: hypothetical protein VF070_02165 [Streptosporangiaceae bacterium]
MSPGEGGYRVRDAAGTERIGHRRGESDVLELIALLEFGADRDDRLQARPLLAVERGHRRGGRLQPRARRQVRDAMHERGLALPSRARRVNQFAAFRYFRCVRLLEWW